MNRFRMNLHPTFNGKDEVVDLTREEDNRGQEVVKENKRKEQELMDEVTMKKSVGRFVQYMDSKYNWQGSDYISQKDSFLRRIKKFSSDDLTKLDNNLLDGYKRLLEALKGRGHFQYGNEKEKLNEVRKLYDTKVFDQYKKYVWDTDDANFSAMKDKLFGQTNINYKCPADEVFYELTGAATIDSITYDKEEKGYSFKKIDHTNKNLPKGNDNIENLDKWSEGKKRDFLSKDVPENLWGIKNVSGRKNFLSKIGIAKIDRPSEQEKKAIRNLLEASAKLQLQPDDTRDKATVLIEIFKTAKTNTTPEEYKKILGDQNITIEEKRLKKLPGIGFEFIGSQKNNWNIYTSIMSIIQQSSGVDEAIKVLYPFVSQAKQNKEKEKRGMYSEGTALNKVYDGDKIRNTAKDLGIEDFTNVSRLANLPKAYFSENSTGLILANLNNDDRSDLGDALLGGLKAGQQFYEIYNYVGEEKALTNLLEHAKLVNKALNLGLKEEEFTEDQIHAGNVKLILLLQEIILRPGEDLLTLLSNSKTESNPELEPRTSGNIIAEIKADENSVITEEDFENLKNMIVEGAKEASKDKNGDSQSVEMVQRLLAENAKIKNGCLVFMGNEIPLSDIASIGWGIDSGGKAGIAFTLKKTENLGRGWSFTPSMSAGGFIGLGNIGWGIDASAEFAKRWLDKKGTTHRIGLNAGATFTGAVILHAGISYYRDKLEGIDEVGEKQMKEMEGKLKDKYLINIKTRLAELGQTMDFNKDDVVNVVREELEHMAQDSGIKKPEEIKQAVNATMRLLTVYNNQDLSKSGVIDSIAKGVSEQYGMAWIEAKKYGIKDKTYFAGASLGAFWVVGTPIVGISVGVKFNKHLLEGVSDQNINRYKKNASLKEIDQDRLAELNRQLGLSEGKKLTLSEDGTKVIIPADMGRDIKVSDDMKGMMIKDNNGNIMVDTYTTITSNANFRPTTQKRELQVGDGPFNQKITEVSEERFTTEEDNLRTKSFEKINETKFYTLEGVKKAIERYKRSGEVAGKLDNYNPTEQEIQKIVSELGSFENKNKIAIITIKRKGDSFTSEVSQTEKDGIGIELRGQGNLELFNEDANKLAERVYSRASTLKDPKPLHAVKHPQNKPHPQYDKFVGYLTGSQKDLQQAKNTVVDIIKEVNRKIKEPDKKLDIDNFQWPTDNVALEQVLLSINNIFARSTKVRGASSKEGENKYEFKGIINKKEKSIKMSDIIREREGGITNTIKKKLKGDIAKLYTDLIGASTDYRVKAKKFDKSESTAAHLNNAVGFNLGDRNTPENPLLNPEIYKDMVDLDQLAQFSDKFTEKERELLHKHAIEMFVKNSALFEPIKANLKISGAITIDNESRKWNDDKTISVNVKVGEETITLTTGMKVGYFTQCVNHTIILDEITVTHNGITQKYEQATTRGDSSSETTPRLLYGLEQRDVTVGVTVGSGDEGNSAVNTQGGQDSKKLGSTNPNGTNEIGNNNLAGGGTGNGNFGGRGG